MTKYRGYCNHTGWSAGVWRGPIHDDRSKAQEDLDEHKNQSTGDHSDSTVIQDDVDDTLWD